MDTPPLASSKSNTELGLLPGVIFALRSRKGQTERNPNNRIHPYFLTYISTDGEFNNEGKVVNDNPIDADKERLQTQEERKELDGLYTIMR